MACLSDFEDVLRILKISNKAQIVTLHKFIFETEGDRNNRRRLREFTGFKFGLDHENYKKKCEYISRNLTQADLTSICLLLGLDYNVDQVVQQVFRNLCENNLLKDVKQDEGGDGEEDEDEEDDEYEGVDDNSKTSKGRVSPKAKSTADEDTVSERSSVPINDNDTSHGIERRHSLNTMRFTMNFRDVEESIRTFDGTDVLSIETWLNEFEETAIIMEWDNFQKFVFAKKLLRGLATLFVKSERGLTTWHKLKQALLEEFRTGVNSAQLHKLLTEKKMKKNENLQEYFLHMKEIASRGNIEDAALIQYVIDGINDSNVNKSIIYGAKNIKDFKEKLKCFEKISERNQQGRQNTKENVVPKQNSHSKEITCYNCGRKGHRSTECPNKDKGVKCFNCNRFGHIAKECSKISNEGNKSNIRSLNTERKNMMKSVKIGHLDYEALFDTGSKYSIIASNVHKELGRPQLKPVQIKLIGFGEKKTGNDIKPLGNFQTKIEIDNDQYEVDFLVVPDTCIDVQILLGSEFCADKEVRIDKGGIRFKRLSREDIEIAAVMAIDTIETDTHEHNIDPTASPRATQRVIELIEQYKPERVKSAKVEMKIILKNETPIFSRPNRLPLFQRSIVDEQIRNWLKEDIIQPSESEFCSPVVLAKKRDGTYRLCIDYRKINKVIIKDRFPLPLIEDQLDRLQRAAVFNTLDLKNGFFHVGITEDSRKYTAFVTNSGQYEFKRVPFGLCNSPAVFIRYIYAIFRQLENENTALPYMADIIIPGNNEEDALQKLERVVSVCKDYGLQLNFKKCQFLKRRVEFLGYVIKKQQISPSPGKVEALVNYKAPQTLKQIQSFLGLASYFRKFIPDFSRIAKPLSDLLKQNNKFTFQKEHIESFSKLKQLLCDKPVLSIFQQGLETEVHTDASIDGFGAVLLQRSAEDGMFHPIYYMSRKTTDAERKYSSYELKVPAVISALKKFRVYLLGQHFKVVTDCDAFTKTLEKKELYARVARWVLFLEDYDFDVEHRRGTRLKHADALSRYAVLTISEKDIITKLRRAQRSDNETKSIMDALQENPKHHAYVMRNGMLYKICGDNELIVVPKDMQRDVIKQAHDRGHFSTQKVKYLIDKDFYIPKLREQIESHINCCIPCIVASRKCGKKEGQLHPLDKGDVPLCTYHIDFIGPLDSTSKMYKHILVVVDAFTKFCWLYPTKSTSAACALMKLKTQSVTFGNPENIVTDSAFTSEEFKTYCETEGIKHIKITTGLPRANGQVERLNGVVSTVLAKIAVEEPTKWYKHVEYVQQCINSTFSRNTYSTPFELLTGVKMRLKDDVRIKQMIDEAITNKFVETREHLRQHAKEQILKVQQENRHNYNTRRKTATLYKVGDVVAIKRTQLGGGLKLRAKYLGPYAVVNAKSNDTYDVVRVGGEEGPRRTSTCAEYMKLWSNTHYEPYDSFGANE